MDVDAKLNYLSMSPQKVRLVADLIRGRKVEEAKNRLKFTDRAATEPMMGLLNSAIANAEHNFDLDEDNLYISELKVDEGPTMKRWEPRARGATNEINKRTSHITIVLNEVEPGEEIKTSKKGKIEIVQKKEKPSEEVSQDQKKDFPEKDSQKKARKGKDEGIFRRKSI